MVAARGVEQVAAEDRVEGVAVRSAEDAVRADHHVDVERVEVVAEQPGGAAALEDAAEDVQSGLRRSASRTATMRCSPWWMFSIATSRMKSWCDS